MKRDFSAAHKLIDYEGNCANLHGHTWGVEVLLEVPDDVDMAIDFREAKQAIENMLPDHTYLNDYYAFNPTAENIAKQLYHDLEVKLPIVQITLWESKDAGAVYP